MSEKFKEVMRKAEEEAIKIPLLCLGILLIIIICIPCMAVVDAFLSMLWNKTMPFMFGFEPITTGFHAVILIWSIRIIKVNDINRISAMNAYYKLKKEYVSNKVKQEKNVKVISIIATIVLMLCSFCVEVYVIKYTWNMILPHLLNVEMCKIDFVQATCFTFFAKYVFGRLTPADVVEHYKNEKEIKNDLEVVIGISDSEENTK